MDENHFGLPILDAHLALACALAGDTGGNRTT